MQGFGGNRDGNGHVGMTCSKVSHTREIMRGSIYSLLPQHTPLECKVKPGANLKNKHLHTSKGGLQQTSPNTAAFLMLAANRAALAPGAKQTVRQSRATVDHHRDPHKQQTLPAASKQSTPPAAHHAAPEWRPAAPTLAHQHTTSLRSSIILQCGLLLGLHLHDALHKVLVVHLQPVPPQRQHARLNTHLHTPGPRQFRQLCRV